jgi:hypothetical protein
VIVVQILQPRPAFVSANCLPVGTRRLTSSKKFNRKVACSEPAERKGFLKSADGGIPAPGKRYVVEEDVSIFETDVPAQHMWSPESGRYRVIWAEKLKTVR